MLQQEPICALATPTGVGAIGVVRVSGVGAIEIVNQVFFGKNLAQVKSHTIHFGTIRSESDIIDEVLVSVFRSPHSYTKEDTIEISCHGSDYIIRQILKLLVKKGARLAKPGEFTQRAFLNGQLDLVQAEAVADLIAADSAAMHRTAINQLRGGFSRQLADLRQELIHFASMVELELDFGEEDVEFANREDLKHLLLSLQQSIAPLLESFDYGNALKEGIPVAIVGAPNVGKSTLLNALLNEEKAIVTDIAGTTRDVIEDVLYLNGVKFRIIDTAGIRETADVVESLGIERSKKAIEKADIVLMLFDSPDTHAAIAPLMPDGKKVIWVQNKVDVETTTNTPLHRGEETGERRILSSVNPLNKVDVEPATNTPPQHGEETGERENVYSLNKIDVEPATNTPLQHGEGTGERGNSYSLNKIDIEPTTNTPLQHGEGTGERLAISAKTGHGLDALKSSILHHSSALTAPQSALTNVRHYEHLLKTQAALTDALNGLETGVTGDFLAQDIRLALHHLGEITGQIATDDLLANIFSKFCIGK